MMKLSTMKKLAIVSATLIAGPVAAADKGSLTLSKAGDYSAGPAKYFTGDVEVGSFFKSDMKDYKGAIVNFSAGAYTNWHTHPRGQTLVITKGEGRAQSEGAEVKTLKPGDTVWIPANVRHWHGAAPDTAMSHIAIQAPDENGEVVEWMEKVDPATYASGE